MNTVDFVAAPYGSFFFYTGTNIVITILTSSGGAVQIKHKGNPIGVSSAYIPHTPGATKLSYNTDGNFIGISEQTLLDNSRLDTSTNGKFLVVNRHNATTVFPSETYIELQNTSMIRLNTSEVNRILQISGYGTYKVSTDYYSYTANTPTTLYVNHTNMNVEITCSTTDAKYLTLLDEVSSNYVDMNSLPLLIV